MHQPISCINQISRHQVRGDSVAVVVETYLRMAFFDFLELSLTVAEDFLLNRPINWAGTGRFSNAIFFWSNKFHSQWEFCRQCFSHNKRNRCDHSSQHHRRVQWSHTWSGRRICGENYIKGRRFRAGNKYARQGQSMLHQSFKIASSGLREGREDTDDSSNEKSFDVCSL